MYMGIAAWVFYGMASVSAMYGNDNEVTVSAYFISGTVMFAGSEIVKALKGLRNDK